MTKISHIVLMWINHIMPLGYASSKFINLNAILYTCIIVKMVAFN
jgi:hypothetical protein